MKKTITITLRNNYHNTSVTLQIPADTKIISRRQIYKARKAFCNNFNCICGGYLRERGEQDIPIPDGKEFYDFEILKNGTVRLVFF